MDKLRQHEAIKDNGHQNDENVSVQSEVGRAAKINTQETEEYRNFNDITQA